MSATQKRIIIFLFLLSLFLGFLFLREKRNYNQQNYYKIVFIDDNGFEYKTKTKTNYLEEFLREKNIELSENDYLYQQKEDRIFSGVKIKIERSQKIVIQADGKKIENHTLAKNIDQVLRENNVKLSRLDKVYPDPLAPPRTEEKIIVTRINVEEKIIPEKIKFKTITKKSSRLGWREEKIEQKGKEGILEVKYKITYKDGKEIKRKVLGKNITKKPTDKIVTKGTNIKFGKSHTGAGTWYAQPKSIQTAYPSLTGYYAANPWLPKGSYVKVTNKINGKNIIAVINDRGPFGEGRIIDLDKKAFSKIASLGAGVIDVKVEEILN